MSVNRDEIQTPEDGLDVKTREAKRAKFVPLTDAEKVQTAETMAEGYRQRAEGYQQRITEARGMIAPPEERHCSECAQRWTNGRDAAIRAIEG